jgi:hypothetical protein
MIFPISLLYNKIARFNAIRYEKGKPMVIANAGVGFVYIYDSQAYFVTGRDYVIIEEKAFLPDSITIHQNIIQIKPLSLVLGNEIPLYDNNEKPVWQVLPTTEQYENHVLIAIPISLDLKEQNPEFCFLAAEQFPKEVFLVMDDKTENDSDLSLSIPVSTALSLADYFLYSEKTNENELQEKIEKKGYSYQNYNYYSIEHAVDINLKIHRKYFAKDMIEMVLVLLEQNIDRLKEIMQDQQNDKSEDLISKTKSSEISTILQVHFKLMRELEKITEQFSDVLEPSILGRIKIMIKILITQEDVISLSHLMKNDPDYVIVKHLIRKTLEQFGNNIVFVQ